MGVLLWGVFFVAKVAKTFGGLLLQHPNLLKFGGNVSFRNEAETLGEFRYGISLRRFAANLNAGSDAVR